MSGKLLLFLSKAWNQPSKEQAAKCACTWRKKSWQTSTRRRKKIWNRMTFLLCIFYMNGAPPVLPSVQWNSGLEEKLHELCIDLSCSCRKCIYSLCLLLEQREGGRDTETCEQNPKHAASELTRQQIRLFPDQKICPYGRLAVLFCTLFSFELNAIIIPLLKLYQISVPVWNSYKLISFPVCRYQQHRKCPQNWPCQPCQLSWQTISCWDLEGCLNITQRSATIST